MTQCLKNAGLLLLMALSVAAAHAAAPYTKMMSGGLERQYVLVTPSLASTQAVPLIVVLHGTVGTGKKMQEGLNFDKYVNSHGFAVAYPDAYIEPGGRAKTTRWNDGRGTLASSKLGVDDVQFLRDMVRDIGTRTRLDMARIYVTGPSNGGIMSYRVACEAADLFAAAAPVIGNVARPIADRCKPVRPISVLALNGTADPFVPFDGGTVCSGVGKFFCEGGEVISSTDSLDIFARGAGCAAKPRQTRLPPRVTEDPRVDRLSYEGCRDGKTVGAYWVQGGGHNWPPNAGQLGKRNGPATRNLDATKVIVEFFMGNRP